jgi:hypothetical protein
MNEKGGNFVTFNVIFLIWDLSSLTFKRNLALNQNTSLNKSTYDLKTKQL